MTVCPLVYNLSNFVRLGPGPSYKFWEVINYRRGINDVAQSLIPMTVCPLLYHYPFSWLHTFDSQPSTHSLSTNSFNTLNFPLLWHHGQIQQHPGTPHGRDAHRPVLAEAPSSGPHAGRVEGMAVDYAWRMRHTSHHQLHPEAKWWVASDGGGHQCPAPATCTTYSSGCAVPANGACAQTLVPWATRQGQPERKHAAHEGSTLPTRASSWCSRDGILTRLAGKVQRPTRDQVNLSFWGKRCAGHGRSWRSAIRHPRCCWCVRKEGRVQHGWNWPLLASPSRQLASNPSGGRPEDQ